MHEAGLPPGVLNVVQTTDADRVTRLLLADERLRKVSFTGSTAVARRILAAAPFGGVKQSGLGREGGFEGVEEYLSTQYIGIADSYADLHRA